MTGRGRGKNLKQSNATPSSLNNFLWEQNNIQQNKDLVAVAPEAEESRNCDTENINVRKPRVHFALEDHNGNGHEEEEIEDFDESILCEKLSELRVKNLNPPEIFNVSEFIKKHSTNKASLEATIEAIYNFSLLTSDAALIGAYVCGEMSHFEVSSAKFRNVLLNKLQESFSAKEEMKYENKSKFLNSIIFFCEVFHKLRLANGSPLQVLVIPLFAYLKMLLLTCGDDEIKIIYEQVRKNALNLKECDEKEFEEFFLEIRKFIITGKGSCRSRSLLLQLIELSHTNWSDLSPLVMTFYKDHL